MKHRYDNYSVYVDYQSYLSWTGNKKGWTLQPKETDRFFNQRHAELKTAKQAKRAAAKAIQQGADEIEIYNRRNGKKQTIQSTQHKKHCKDCSRIGSAMKLIYSATDYNKNNLILDILSGYRSEIERVCRKQQRDENDFRTGEDTYGYESDESNMINLEYISDRWNVGFRLKWLLDLIDLRSRTKRE